MEVKKEDLLNEKYAQKFNFHDNIIVLVKYENKIMRCSIKSDETQPVSIVVIFYNLSFLKISYKEATIWDNKAIFDWTCSESDGGNLKFNILLNNIERIELICEKVYLEKC